MGKFYIWQCAKYDYQHHNSLYFMEFKHNIIQINYKVKCNSLFDSMHYDIYLV